MTDGDHIGRYSSRWPDLINIFFFHWPYVTFVYMNFNPTKTSLFTVKRVFRFGRNVSVLTSFVFIILSIKIPFLKIKMIPQIFRLLGSNTCFILKWRKIILHFVLKTLIGQLIWFCKIHIILCHCCMLGLVCTLLLLDCYEFLYLTFCWYLLPNAEGTRARVIEVLNKVWG